MAAPTVTPRSKPLTPAEEEELKKLQEEEEAKKEAIAAAELQKKVSEQAAAAVASIPKPTSKTPPVKRFVGDITVTCLRNESFCTMGGRKYNLQKGHELEMDPGHAEELSQGEFPFVAPVHVSRSA